MTITLRQTKGSRLTHAEADANITSFQASDGSSLVGFIQSGTGAVAELLQTILRNIAITPEQFGAVGDGVTDDTPAIILAGNRLQTLGRGTLRGTPGKNYLIYKNGVGYAQAPILLSGGGPFNIDFSACTITLDPAKSWTGVTAAFVDATAVNGLKAQFGYVTGPALNLASGIYHGLGLITLRGDCVGIDIPYIRANQIGVPLNMLEPTSVGTTNIKVGIIDATSCFYSAVGQNSGSNFVADNIICTSGYRGFFFYGIKHLKANIRTLNSLAPRDVYLQANTAGFETVEDIEINYTNLNSNAGVAAYGVQLLHGNSDVVVTTFRDIRINLHVKYAAANQMGPAFVYGKDKANGDLDTVDRGHTLRGLKVSGFIDGTPSAGTPVMIGEPGNTWGTGENVYDITCRDLKVINNTQDTPIVLSVLGLAQKGPWTLDNVWSPRAIDVFGSAGASISTHADARLFLNAVVCTNMDKIVNAAQGLRTITQNSSPVTVLPIHREHIIDNVGSGGTVVYNLPISTVGMEYGFARAENQTMQINPDGTEVIRGGGAGKYLSLDALGTSVTLRCYIAGTWEIIRTNGTTSFEP